MQQKRLEYIDVLKGLCMFAIMVEHSCFTSPQLWQMCHGFSSRTFFFISGLFFLSQTKPYSLRRKLTNIATMLLAPYLIYWFASYALLEVWHGRYDFLSAWLGELWQGQKLWFMPSLIVCETLAALYCSLPWGRLRRAALLLLPLLFLCVHALLPEGDYPWCFRMAMLAGVFLSAGIVCRPYLERMQALARRGVTLPVLCVLAVLVTLADMWWTGGSTTFHLVACEYATFFPLSVVYISLVFSVAIRWTRGTRLLCFIGEYSLLYYFFQTQVLRAVDSVAERFVAPTSAAMALLTAFVAALLLIPVVYVTKRWFPLLAGKYRVGR